MSNLRATVHFYGDPDVGIPGWDGDIPLPMDEFYDNERELIREDLRKMYADIIGDGVDVTFSDEWTEDGLPKKT